MSPADDFSLTTVRKLAEEFAARHLDDYVAKIRDGQKKFSRKEVNDSLWGTITLAPSEVALLDSPLLQRLRYVRQLGVVHWVYPGATHTRFEHTLGVVHQVQHLVSAVNAIALQRERTPYIDHVDCALTLLDKFRMISRADTIATLKGFIEENPDFDGAAVVPLGSVRDSGSIW